MSTRKELKRIIEARREKVRPDLRELAELAEELGINEANEECMTASLVDAKGQLLKKTALKLIADDLEALQQSCTWHLKTLKLSDELYAQAS